MISLINDDCFNSIKDINDNSIDLIIIDPPYLTTNENWDKKEVVNDVLSKELFRVAKDTCSIYIWCGIGEKSQSLIRWFPIFQKYWHFKDLITWKKQRGIGMRKGWLYTREECMWFVKDNKKFIWNKEEQYNKKAYVGKRKFGFKNLKNKDYKISEYKRFTNIWEEIPEISWDYRNKPCHFTPKPVELAERIIKLHTKENDIVLDCFMGSGFTGKACVNLNRNFIGIEKDKDIFNDTELDIKNLIKEKSLEII